jgi:hypothetical protein
VEVVLRFIKFLFGKKKLNIVDEIDSYDELQQDDNDFVIKNVHSAVQRNQVVTMHCEKIKEAARELERLEVEYCFVSDSLLDCDAIDSFPQLEKEDLRDLGKRIRKLDFTRTGEKNKKQKLTRMQFIQMQKIEDEMPEGCEKLEEAEGYQEKIKRDLVKLNGEKQAYIYRRNELYMGIENAKGMAKICFVALIICFLILLVLKMFLEMDIQVGGLLAIAIAAITITIFFSRFLDYSGELKGIEKDINKLILLQNKVKIRYINNVNLLDYLYIKYAVSNGKELRKTWKIYQEEKHEQEQYEKIKIELEDLYKQVLHILTRNKISDTSVWLHQTEAFVDEREMVEVRHGLNNRRQKLREQIEYNTKEAELSKIEIKNVVEEYPQYAKEILEIVEAYEKSR